MESKPLPLPPEPPLCPVHAECTEIPTLFRPRLRHVVEVSMRNVIPPLEPEVYADTPLSDGESGTHVFGASDASSDQTQGHSDPEPTARAVPTRHDSDLGSAVDLEDLPSCFFELSVPGSDVPVYTSEVVEHSSNPTWLPIQGRIKDLNGLRSGVLLFSTWLSRKGGGGTLKGKERDCPAIYRNLEIDLAGLVHLGKDLSNLRVIRGVNELIFLLKDGYYVYCGDCAFERAEQLPPPWRVDESRTLRSYDAESILRLNQSQALLTETASSLETTRLEASAAIEALDEEQEPFNSRDHQSFVASQADKDVVIMMLENDQESQRVADRRNELERRRENILALENDFARRKEELEEGIAGQLQDPAHHELLLSSIRERQAVLIRELAEIYRISPIKDKNPPQFTINGVYLPNSDLDDNDMETTATALGYACHVICIVAAYMDIDLRYPMLPRSSRSTVRDEISRQHAAAPEFPLYCYGQDRFRYGYGVFLLNKNIEQLMNHAGLTASNLRHTLPNLDFLLKALQRADLAPRSNGTISHSIPASPSNTWK